MREQKNSYSDEILQKRMAEAQREGASVGQLAMRYEVETDSNHLHVVLKCGMVFKFPCSYKLIKKLAGNLEVVRAIS